jgi:hypothetical protein
LTAGNVNCCKQRIDSRNDSGDPPLSPRLPAVTVSLERPLQYSSHPFTQIAKAKKEKVSTTFEKVLDEVTELGVIWVTLIVDK